MPGDARRRTLANADSRLLQHYTEANFEGRFIGARIGAPHFGTRTFPIFIKYLNDLFDASSAE